ncbi:spherulation-specific family 4 protein [Streptomyces sp. NPDC086091]|uniref:spherulation-specific family 4 protein n=1 Tax=Streptomyces sp. NPDC086091 TaxID=3365751 RepID=UPI0037FDE291
MRLPTRVLRTRLLASTVAALAVSVTVTALPSAAAPSAAAPAVAAAAGAQKVSVPSYFFPGATWDRLIQSGGTVGLTVANPNNGPHTDAPSRDAYLATLRKADAAGVRVIGYVPTGYLGTTGMTTRTGSTDPTAWMTQIKADIDTWYSLYGGAGLDGVFLDEGLAQCGTNNVNADRYRQLRDHIEAKGDEIVVANPGTGTQECFKDAADTLVTFEGTADTYRSYRPQAWEAGVPADRIWHLVHATPQSRLAETVRLSKERNAGHVYVTDDVLDNPWDQLPPAGYWQSLLDQAGRSA